MAKDNVIIFRKQHKLNIAVVALLVIFIYVAGCIFIFFSKEQIVGYEVREGSLIEQNRYEAVILRSETLFTSPITAYVNYFASERERVAVGNLVCTLDESGTVMEYVEAAASDSNALDSATLQDMRSTLDDFVKTYTESDLGSLYTLNQSLTNAMDKIAYNNLLKDIGTISSLSGLVQYQYATRTGIVAYWEDGLEDLTADAVTSSLFDKTDYEMHQLIGNSLVGAGETIYKLYENEQWSIAFPLEDTEKAQMYLDEEVLEIQFLKNNISLWGTVSLTMNSEGETIVVLTFNSGSVNFCTDRFLEIEVLMEDETGLKIPISAIAEKEFYLVPKEYVLYVEEEDTYYINIESFMEDGTRSIVKTAVEPYSFQDGQYYLDSPSLEAGSRLIKTDSEDSYVISLKGSLVGVYNMNKGYADFKQITVKKQNESYAIVESNTAYGLNVYDYIVLNASAVNDDDFVN